MTYGEVLPIWWSMAWRGILGGAAAGFAAGFLLGFIGALLGQAEMASLWGGVAGMIVAIPVSIWALKAALNKHNLRPVKSQFE